MEEAAEAAEEVVAEEVPANLLTNHAKIQGNVHFKVATETVKVLLEAADTKENQVESVVAADTAVAKALHSRRKAGKTQLIKNQGIESRDSSLLFFIGTNRSFALDGYNCRLMFEHSPRNYPL